MADNIRQPGFLAGGGEMGERMRAFDWAATPLGPPAGWPQSLKTAVRILLTSRQPMWVWWGDALVNLYNDAYRPILGGKHPWALGQPATSVWSEIWEQLSPRVESAMGKNEGTYDEALLLLMERNGYPEETYYTFSYSPVPDDDGGTGGIICANTDDTQRIVGERQLMLLRALAAGTAEARTLDEACRRSAECLASDPFDLPFAMIYLVDGDRLVLAGNTGIESGHALVPAAASLEAPSLWPFAEVLRDHRARLVSGLPDGLPRGPWARSPHEAVVAPIAPAGETGRQGLLVVGLNPYRLFDDRYRGFVELVAAQIAASLANARAYEEERGRAEALAELDRAKTDFFSNVSHEFRTPLTLMLGPTEDALASPEGALAGESLRILHRNELRLLKLVNSLLDFSRIEAGRAQASYRPTDLPRLTADLASSFRAAIERAGLRFEVSCPPLEAPVFVDHDLWEKIVLNLLSNALKFTFEGAIGVELRQDGDAAELTVRDSGVGIPAAELPHLFERFHRVEGARSRTHEGSGIGLALVSELVRLHGGRVTVESRVGQGTSFHVRLPLGAEHLPAERVDRARAEPAQATGTAPYVEEALRWLPGESATEPALISGERILLADDNADMRDYVRRLLSERWTVEAVADGAEALAAARRERPDLVLTDVMMPNLDGFGLVRELRADPELRRLPILMLSARAGEESRVEGLERGADDYLAKPFAARELLARVAIHLQIARLREAAESERVKLYSLFTQAPVPVAVMIGPEHRFEVANPAFCRMTAEGAPLVGKKVREAFPEIPESALAVLDRAYRTGEPLRTHERQLTVTRGGHKEEAFFDYALQPLRDEAGAVIGLMTVSVEVTEQVLARQRIDRLRAEAEEANRAKDEFLAMLGHELRNPLAPITTALHLMRLRAGPVCERERTVIERQVSHLTRLVDDLLDVSRITRGKIELKRQRVELSEVIAKAIELSSPLFEQRQHHLALSVPSRSLAVEGDPVRLAQVVSNLLTNAAKYTEAGGHVSVHAERHGERALIEISDDGIGIPAEILPRVFELFVQDRQALDRSLGGLGLGLAIVRSLVELHGGTVSAHSDGRGRGSRFLIELPAAPDLAKEAEALAPDAPVLHADGRRILVVDDNQDAAELLSETLGALGHSPRIALDGPAALRIAGEWQPEIALVDLGLPVMDGYELARRLRQEPSLSGLRLIAVTGYGQEEDRRQSHEAGFDSHLVKPVPIEALDALLAR